MGPETRQKLLSNAFFLFVDGWRGEMGGGGFLDNNQIVCATKVIT